MDIKRLLGHFADLRAHYRQKVIDSRLKKDRVAMMARIDLLDELEAWMVVDNGGDMGQDNTPGPKGRAQSPVGSR
jgi:hypothetical protein